MLANLSMHCIRRQIDLARPSDRAMVNENLLKKPHVQQRSENACKLLAPQLYTPSQPVFETHKEAIARLGFHFNDVPMHETTLPSRQRIDLRRLGFFATKPPVFQQFFFMYHPHS